MGEGLVVKYIILNHRQYMQGRDFAQTKSFSNIVKVYYVAVIEKSRLSYMEYGKCGPSQ